MSSVTLKTPQALRDIEILAGYIQEHNPRAAHHFLEAAEKTFALIASQPQLGQAYPHPAHPGLRVCTLGRQFRNYLAFFLPTSEGVTIVRVLHGARDLPRVLDE